jgi:hypothetical protein
VLQAWVVERDQAAAALADKMVMMVTAGMCSLKPRLSIADREAFDQAMLEQQVKHAVDAGARGGAPLTAQLILDLNGAQGTGFRRQQLDHPLPRPPSPVSSSGEHAVNVSAPIDRCHRAKA